MNQLVDCYDKRAHLRATTSLAQAAFLYSLDPYEVAWAIEEYGRCSTDQVTILPHAELSGGTPK